MKLNVRLLLIHTLCFAMAFMPSLQLLAEAAPNYSMVPFDQKQPTNGMTPKGQFNFYQSLGLAEAPSEIKSAQIKSAIDRGFPQALNHQKIANFEEKIKTSQGRSQLSIELRQSMNLLAQASQKNLLSEFSRVYDADSKQLKKWNSTKNAGRWSLAEINERATLRSLKVVIESNFSAENATKAKQIHTDAAKTLSKSNLRAKYDVNNGYRTFKPSQGLWHNVTRHGDKLVVKTKNPDGGKSTKISLDIPSQKQMKTLDIPELARKVKSGAVTGLKLTGLTAAVITMLHGIAYAKLMTDYSHNPRVVEDSWDEMINPLFVLSIGSFFVGAQAADASLYRRAVNYARNLAIEKRIFADRPLEAKKAKLTSLANLSYWGLSTGLLASMLVLQGGKKLQACLPLFNDRPIKERAMSKQEKATLESMCQQGWFDYLGQYKGQFFVTWAALASAKYLLALGTPMGSAGHRTVKGMIKKDGKFGDFKKHHKEAKIQRIKQVEVMGKGTKITSARALVSMGLRSGIQMTLVVGLAVGSLWGYEKVSSAYGIHKPVTTNFDNVNSTMAEIENKEWQILPTECDENNDNCGAQKYVNVFTDYQSSMDAWRNYNMRSVSEAMTNWSNFYAKPMNLYRAAKLFYKDLVMQIVARRKSDKKMSVEFGDKGRPILQTYTSMSDEVLPLFRSTPFFGVKIDNNAYPTPDMLPVDGDWETYANKDFGFLKTDRDKKKAHIKKVADNLEAEYNKAKGKIKKTQAFYIDHVIKQLRQDSDLNVLSGINSLSEQAQNSRNKCSAKGAINKPECLAYKAYGQLSDFKMWAPFKFPFTAGYQRHRDDKAFGAAPLPAGHLFLTKYHNRLNMADVDSGWYEGEAFKREMNSMAEYLTYSAICGPEALNSFSKPWWKVGFSPKFTPPKLPLKTNFDICEWAMTIGLVSPTAIWFNIPNPDEGKRYAGIIDFLYQEIGDSIASEEGFDHWWDNYVRPAMERSIVESNKDFQKDIIEKALPKALHRSDKSSPGWQKVGLGKPQLLGYMPSIRSEFELYFDKIFNPMVERFESDLSHFEQGKAPANFDRLSHFQTLRDDFYRNFEDLTNYRGLSKDELSQLQIDTSLALDRLKIFFNADSMKSGMEDFVFGLDSRIEKMDSLLTKLEETEKSDSDNSKEIIRLTKELKKYIASGPTKASDSKDGILSEEERTAIRETIKRLKGNISKTQEEISDSNQARLQFDMLHYVDEDSGETILNEWTGKPKVYSEQQMLPEVAFAQMSGIIFNLGNLLQAVQHVDQILDDL